MATTVTCPDCGGVIGAMPSGDSGYPCTCVNPGHGAAGPKPPPPPARKVCCRCGKDLTGHKRYHDSLGYWCKDCHSSDKEENKVEGVRCVGCRRIVAEEKLEECEGLMLCGRCRRERREMAKEKIRTVVISEAHEQLEVRRLVVLAVIVLVLLAIIILYKLQIIPPL